MGREEGRETYSIPSRCPNLTGTTMLSFKAPWAQPSSWSALVLHRLQWGWRKQLLQQQWPCEGALPGLWEGGVRLWQAPGARLPLLLSGQALAWLWEESEHGAFFPKAGLAALWETVARPVSQFSSAECWIICNSRWSQSPWQAEPTPCTVAWSSHGPGRLSAPGLPLGV